MVKIRKKFMCALLAALMLCTLAVPGVSAASAPTSLQFAEHGIKAYDDGWLYAAGGKGQYSNGVRVSDCAGLIYAFFSDNGISGCYGGSSSQVNNNCIFSGDIYEEGVPNIHGLAMSVPDYYDPLTGYYGHIGIYVGDGIVIDNSDYNVNMRKQAYVENKSWNAWHVFDLGVVYPSDGWYSMNGKMYHYTNCEYDTNTVVDGYKIGADGIALNSDGTPLAVNNSMPNSGYVSASKLASVLKAKGYDGKDSTGVLLGVESPSEENASKYNGKVTGEGVRLRSEPNTSSSIVTTMYSSMYLNILEEVKGQSITDKDVSSDIWYRVKTAAGHTGYVSSLFVKYTTGGSSSSGTAASKPAAPVISAKDGSVTISSSTDGASIYYTTDGTEPTASSALYTKPVNITGVTYRAIAVSNGVSSSVTTASVFSNSAVFTDVLDNQWYFESVDKALKHGLFGGTGANKFSPKNNITRGQFVLVLSKLSGIDMSPYKGYSEFSDVSSSASYAAAVNWAAKMGYVGGFEDGTFRPDSSITREQMCKILVGYSGLTSNESSAPFADDSSIAAWARDSVYACRDNGIINGKGNNNFDPKGTALRAEAAKVFVNFYEMIKG